ncbi:MAG: acetoacetate--CoA ligase [bacterium]|nr:acetoacetate--CoA ligase [bacterium]
MSRNDKTETEPLWRPRPESVQRSNMTRFAEYVGQKQGRSFDSYDDLYNWSVTNRAQFWEAVWNRSDLIHSQAYNQVLSSDDMPGARWFEGARLNFAENLLRHRDDKTAIIHHRENAAPVRLTYREVYRQVAACAAGLKKLGVTRGDRVAAFIPNIPETVVAMLATASIGALWSSCSPDFGHRGALDRLGQIKPRVLITADGYSYQGKQHDSCDRVARIAQAIPDIAAVIVVPVLGDRLPETKCHTVTWRELLSEDAQTVSFEQMPFDHPVYVMYSSGTTGVPKCIVHGAGGTLLQHYKEHVLHTNLTPGDVILYYTTTGWMMWNWLVSALQVGATVFLYDGSPTWPDAGVLWQALEQEKANVFGTSPRFLTHCQKESLHPAEDFDLSALRTVLSTGSPLTAENYAWVYDAVKSDVQLSSISGGTDIISCFMLGNPNLPVYSEEIQCRGLGMKVEAFNDSGQSVEEEIGDLVCTAPFPSMPTGFWNDPDHSLYRSAYFEQFPGVWRHGDFVRITSRGGVRVYGRSDATLNPGGVRIGTAEIYNPVDSMDEVVDSVAVGQKTDGDVRIVLFVVLSEGLVLSDELIGRIKSRIRELATPRHVPALIKQVAAVPHTINGKKVELAVTRIIHGLKVPNLDSLANPEALDEYRNILKELPTS